MQINKYVLETQKFFGSITVAVVSDLHARPYDKALEAIQKISPDLILMPGDIVEIAVGYMNERNQNGLEFLKKAAKIAPSYYCYGNHEIYFSHAKGKRSKTPDPELSEEYLKRIESMGIHLINDSFESLTVTDARGNEITLSVGGLVCGRDMDPALNSPEPNLDFANRFSEKDGYKILLCHYPHYFEKYFKNAPIDLILSGHAHGGQWRFFRRGIYAPHQGIFPKFTAGLHDGKHIISRGAANNVSPIPRFFNPCEVLGIKIIGREQLN